MNILAIELPVLKFYTYKYDFQMLLLKDETCTIVKEINIRALITDYLF